MNAPAETHLSLSIGGMTCASCVAHVEKALRAASGVKSASVNLASEKAELTLATGADLVAIAARVTEEGYEPRVQTLTFGVGDMSCASCVAHVEKALKAVPGVLDARANLASARATVDFFVGAVEYPALAAAVRAEGYEPQVLGPQGPDPLTLRAAETAALKRKFILAAVLAAPVVILEMGVHASPALHHWLSMTVGQQAINVLSALLTTLVLFGPGRRFFTLGFASLARRAPDMNALVALGAGAAYLYSLVAVFAPFLLPEGTRHSYFESADVIVAFILLGRFLEARAKSRAADAIGKLSKLRPETAHISRDGVVADLPLDEVRAGDILEVRPGESVPTDGELTDGASHVDESLMTGEPVPVAKKAGDAVVGGTLNLAGAFSMRATKVGADTALAGIMRMVEQAQGAKLPIQELADRVTARFVPAVLGLAALTFALWMIFGPAPALSLALVNAVNVLIIACPCAMGLATPAALMVATGRAAELGILFRQGDALQKLSEVKTIAFDKTGTLTRGKPALLATVAAPGFDEAALLRLAAAVEAKSEHPLGRALVAAAVADLPPVENFVVKPGYGVSGLVEDRQVAVGSSDFLEGRGVATNVLEAPAAERAGQGQNLFFVALDGVAAGLFAFADPPRAEAREALDRLHALGLQTAMITGDREAAARWLAGRIGLDDVAAGVKPDGKVAALKRLAARGAVAFVGDGVNDAPALAAADVGIAIGTGTDIARDSAQVVLMADDLRKVAQAVALSRATLRNIKQNLFWAFGYNVLLVPVAMGALYPINGALLNPGLGAAAMSLSSLFVLANALRLRRFA